MYHLTKGKMDQRIALFGCGYWGRNLARNLHEFACLEAICDTDPAAASELRKVFSGVAIMSDSDSIFRLPQITAVAIATPAVSHYQMIKKCLLADKDVFVEKPLALDLQEAEELVQLAESRKLILMVGHILQYHPALIKLKELVTQGELGKIQYIYSNRLNIGRLRTEENILWSFAPHDISAILMLLGEEPVRISAFGGDYLNRGIFDTTLTTLEFRNGTKGHIFVSWLHPYKEQRLIVVGSRAMAVFDDMVSEKLCIYPHDIEWKDGKIPVAHKAESKVIVVEHKEPLKEELRHFLECLQTRQKPKTDGEEGLRVLRVLSKAEQLLQTKSHE